jgi:hypothetical protein
MQILSPRDTWMLLFAQSNRAYLGLFLLSPLKPAYLPAPGSQCGIWAYIVPG